MMDELIAHNLKTNGRFTVNPRPLDYANVKCNLLQKLVFKIMYGKQKEYEEQLQKVGLKDEKAFSCTCYQPEVGNIPKKGDILAWAESSAVVYANSVIGARSNRNSGIIELFCGILGKAPEFGLLTDEGRRAKWLVEVKTTKVPNAQVLGSAIGMKVVEDVPYITGLDRFLGAGLPPETCDYLKDMGAASASNGAGCTTLQQLVCTGNEGLTTLNATDCPSLVKLSCYNNILLGALYISGSTALEEISCNSNSLTQLNLSEHKALRRLSCRNNRLVQLNLSKHPALEYLDCSDNNFQAIETNDATKTTNTLNITQCYALRELYCRNNTFTNFTINGFLLTTLDISGCKGFQEFNCRNNALTTLIVDGCTEIEQFYCDSNQLTTLDVSSCTALRELTCNNNKLTALYANGCKNLKSIFCENNQLTSLTANENLNGCIALESLYCSDNLIARLELKECLSLKTLKCRANQLTSLDLSGLESLESVDCGGNMLGELLLDGCLSLNYLDCYYNAFTFSTLPDFTARPGGDYIYAPQKDIPIGDANGEIIINEELDLSAVGDSSTTFTWYRWDVKSHFEYPILPTTKEDGVFTFGEDFGGEYILCKMTNEKFPELELETTRVLVQPTRPEITLQPNEQTVGIGGTAVFTIEAEVSYGGSLTYQWQVSTDKGESWTDIEGATEASYKTPAASLADNGKQYRCKVTNTYKGVHIEVYSEAVTLNVVPEPVITRDPEGITLPVGEDAEFSVEAEADGEVRYQWQRSTDQGKNWEDIEWETKSKYTIRSVDFSNNGTWYRCAVTNTQDNVTSNPVYSKPAVLSVVADPTIITHPQNVMVSPGESATFAIEAEAADEEEGGALSYQWQLSTDQGSTWEDIPGATAASYRISPVTIEDHGNMYRCMVKNTKNDVDCSHQPYSLGATLSVIMHQVTFIRPTDNDSLNISNGSLVIAEIDGDMKTIIHLYIKIDETMEKLDIPSGNIIYYLLPTYLQDGEHTITITLFNQAGQEISASVSFHWDSYRRGFGFGRFDLGEADTHAEE
jgi:hypothetical protein